MDPTAIGGGGGGGGGPAPFLIKTYDMVDSSSTDDIVSWSSTSASFVVWDPAEFAAKLLPTYFKHNNFSSFIRQLNTYGFRKIDPERWEFANEEFIKGQKHLLKNIHRRKPIHSHTHPQGLGISDSERASLEEEVDRLLAEKDTLRAILWRFRQQQTGTNIQLEDLERRLLCMEKRQVKMITFLERAVQNPRFVENLVNMAGPGASGDSGMQKKNTPGESGGLRDKLKLGVCPAAVSNSNLGTVSTHCSNEEEGTSLMFPSKTSLFEYTDDVGDGLISCHSNLSLASSSMQLDRSVSLTRTLNLLINEVDAKKQEDASADGSGQDLQEAALAGTRGSPPPPGGANDVFWEQFLTESPGSLDMEEASYSFRANPSYEQQEERKPSKDSMWKNRRDLEQLTL